MPTHPRARSRLRRWLWLAGWASACVGTPTPEPPDYAPELLPTPDGGLIFGTPVLMPASAPELPTAPVAGPAGSVAPGAQVWIVNLDNPALDPIETQADASGSFSTNVPGRGGDRVRLVARTPRRHSLPLDARIVMSELGAIRVASLPPKTLPCLVVQPAQELAVKLGEGQTARRSVVLDNRCADAVRIERAVLRFGDQGFTLATPPDSVPANESASLELVIEGQADTNERADIVLLDVQSGGVRGRYALGVWSASSDGTGND